MTTLLRGRPALLALLLPLLASLLALPAASAAEAARCSYVNIGELPLQFLGSGFAPVIEGSINGKPATMLVDTGAYASALTNLAVERLDLAARATGRHAEGIGGSSRLFRVHLDEFGVGPTRSKALYLDVLGDMAWQPGFEAIIGADFLFQSDIEIALADKVVRFFRPLGCDDDSFLAYWAKDAVVVPLKSGFGRSKNKPFTVELNGVKFDAIIDTGANRTTVFEGAARKAGVAADHASSRDAGSAVGIGSNRMRQRSAVFQTFTIGGETIRDAELAILPDTNVPGFQPEILVGADFLRRHRVLFAMSQRQLYISYLGGEVFERDAKGVPDWLQQEADSGNADARFALASRYAAGKLVPRDAAKAAALLELAAAQKHPASLLALAELRKHEHRYADAASLYTTLLAQRPDDRRLWLMLYMARLYAGEGQPAAAELGARLAADSRHPWPAPVGDYLLGRLDVAGLMAAAASDSESAKPRQCDAKAFMVQLADARGDSTLAKSLAAERAAECRPAPK